MGTLCKNCPFKGVKRTEGSCTELFAKKYHNSCVTYDISKHQFLKELNEFEKQMKTDVREMTEEEQKKSDEAIQNIIEEMPKTDTFFQELPLDVKDVPPKEEKHKRTRKASSKKASTKKVKKEITKEIKSETNDENTVTD